MSRVAAFSGVVAIQPGKTFEEWSAMFDGDLLNRGKFCDGEFPLISIHHMAFGGQL